MLASLKIPGAPDEHRDMGQTAIRWGALALLVASAVGLLSSRPVTAAPPELGAWCAKFNERVRPRMALYDRLARANPEQDWRTMADTLRILSVVCE